MEEQEKKEKAAEKAAAEDKNVHAGHRQRMKDAFFKNGLRGMQPHQILEIVLYNTIPYVDTNGLAHRLIDRFGSLAGVFDAAPEELLRVSGVKPATVFLLKLIPELSRVYYEQHNSARRVSTTQELAKLFDADFRGRGNEIVAVVLLSSGGKVLDHEILHEGSVNAVPVYKRRIVELCLRYNASTVVLAHNHPSGSLMPSANDLQTTAGLVSALGAIDVSFWDHLIFLEDGSYISLRASGWMKEILTRLREPPAPEDEDSET